MTDVEKLRVVIFYDGGAWVAQCLEYDIGAQAKDLAELQRRFDVAVRTELAESLERNGAPFKGIGPAPKFFHDMWEKQSGSFDPALISRDEDGNSKPEYQMALVA